MLYQICWYNTPPIASNAIPGQMTYDLHRLRLAVGCARKGNY
jgi:hypothetical protein